MWTMSNSYLFNHDFSHFTLKEKKKKKLTNHSFKAHKKLYNGDNNGCLMLEKLTFVALYALCISFSHSHNVKKLGYKKRWVNVEMFDTLDIAFERYEDSTSICTFCCLFFLQLIQHLV